MKIKKRIRLFIIVGAISITTTFNISFSASQHKKILAVENIEALANKESIIPDVVRERCSATGGFCLTGGVEYFGICMAND